MNDKQYEKLYQKSVELSVKGDIAELFDIPDCDSHALDCLTNPRQYRRGQRPATATAAKDCERVLLQGHYP